MSQKVQPVRGTQDLLGEEYLKHQKIIQTSESVSTLFGYEPIETPIFEQTGIFKRSIGESSDIVGKEMYSFQDKGGEEITLRPEGTASVMRAVISNGLTQSMPLKLIYSGPMMRYERPQLGRRRQFHQVGVECLGIHHPLSDVECITMAARILKKLDVLDRTVLNINTLGDKESRLSYREALVAYFTPNRQHLSADSQVRLEKNPLRILDSKDEGDRHYIEKAPTFEEYLSSPSQEFFAVVCQGLQDQGVSFSINRHLVRGLDYYNHTAFEFITTDLGAQGTVLAGGRYDGLVAQLGGPEIPGVGWALGIDRLALMIETPQLVPQTVSVIPVSPDQFDISFQVAMELRSQGIVVDFGYSGNMNKRLQRANKIQSVMAVLMGEDEVKNNQLVIKDLRAGTQQTFDKKAGIAYLKSQLLRGSS